jgi:hypothetical protein
MTDNNPQVPAPAAAPGTPPAGDPPPAPTDPPPGQAPKVFDEAYVQTLRSESADYRTKLRAAEEKLTKLENAQLSETERAKKEATDAQTKAQQLEKDLKDSRVRAEIAVQAPGLKIVDADAAHKLLDGGAIQFDDQGKPTNVKTLLEVLVKDKPFLIQQAGTTTPPNNPARDGSNTLTKEAIEKMSPQEINANWEQVQKVLAAG